MTSINNSEVIGDSTNVATGGYLVDTADQIQATFSLTANPPVITSSINNMVSWAANTISQDNWLSNVAVPQGIMAMGPDS